jgi:hypothetical protein
MTNADGVGLAISVGMRLTAFRGLVTIDDRNNTPEPVYYAALV